MKELTIEATPENVDELFANIAHYAYNSEMGYFKVRGPWLWADSSGA